MHIGLVITIFGLSILLIYGNQFKQHSANTPFAIFSFGVIAWIPYFHVMIINGFFRRDAR
jgi:hypothetical protein